MLTYLHDGNFKHAAFLGFFLSFGSCHVQVEDIVRAAKRACYRSVPMAAAA
jgi:hypothetical protein